MVEIKIEINHIEKNKKTKCFSKINKINKPNKGILE